MSKRPRDNQRSKVYKSERAIDERIYDKRGWCVKSTCGGRLDTMSEIEDWLNTVLESRWFQSFMNKNGNVSIYQFDIRDGRGSRRGRAWYWPSSRTGVVALPRWTRSKMYILHEVAHTVTPRRYAAHSPEFCANYLELVRRWIGKETADDLKASFKEHRVKFRRSSKS
jgi:putative metallohydrolase (TIGR04338 family)